MLNFTPQASHFGSNLSIYIPNLTLNLNLNLKESLNFYFEKTY